MKNLKKNISEPKILGPNTGYTDLLDYVTTEDLKERKSSGKKYHPLRPSSAGHCSRKLALELMEYRGKAEYGSPVKNPEIERLFSLGHFIEWHSLKNFRLLKKLQQRYKQQTLTFFELETKDKTRKPELIEGSCDVIFWSDEYKCIMDVKSKKDSFSQFYKTRWEEDTEKYKKMDSLVTISDTAFYADNLEDFIEDLNSDFLVDNLYQLNFYARSVFVLERNIDHALIYQYNKNDSRHRELRFRPSQKIFDKVKDKFNFINKSVDDNKIPEVCDFPIGTAKCAFCDCHRILPYSNEDPLKEYFKTWPKKAWPKDIDRLNNSEKLRVLFYNYTKGLELSESEDKIIKELNSQKVKKIKLNDGQVFEVKYLKSPKPHYELRRSKV